MNGLNEFNYADYYLNIMSILNELKPYSFAIKNY